MEWTLGIVASGGELWADVESKNQGTCLVALTELYRRGLPVVAQKNRKKLIVNFRDFLSCNARHYTDYFGIQVPEGKVSSHQVFEVLHHGNAYLVPALALMRALFKPSTKLLCEMFAPSALERTFWLDYSNGTVNIVVDAKWATSSLEKRHINWRLPLSWMASHPTARRMADSVHQYAMAGHLALDLAHCETEVVFSGAQGPNALFVTEARILSITPSEYPDLHVVGCEHPIDFLDRDWAKGRNVKEPISEQVPTHADGTFDLTDEEWAVIAPLLSGARERSRPYKLCQRSLFDGILNKLGTGKSWLRCSYKVGDWRNASTSYRSWKLRGTIGQVLVVLRQMR